MRVGATPILDCLPIRLERSIFHALLVDEGEINQISSEERLSMTLGERFDDQLFESGGQNTSLCFVPNFETTLRRWWLLQAPLSRRNKEAMLQGDA